MVPAGVERETEPSFFTIARIVDDVKVTAGHPVSASLAPRTLRYNVQFSPSAEINGKTVAIIESPSQS